jgi:hypothetical protein
LMNQLRAILLERGIVVPQGVFQLGRHIRTVLDEEHSALSPRVRSLITDMLDQWRVLDTLTRSLRLGRAPTRSPADWPPSLALVL